MVRRHIHGARPVEADLTAQEPVGRLGESDEMAAAMAGLCSGQASCITGQAVAAGGGWTAR